MKTGWTISFENAKSGAGLQFLLLGRMATAQVKGVVLFADSGIMHVRVRSILPSAEGPEHDAWLAAKERGGVCSLC